MNDSPVWDTRVQFVITDVDDTLAPAFGCMRHDVAQSLSTLIRRGARLLLVSGQSVANIFRRVIVRLPPELRRHILVAHCNGAEVFGFSDGGQLISPCLWSSVTRSQLAELRITLHIVKSALNEFGLTPSQARSLHGRQGKTAAILDDRRVQISIDIIDRATGDTDQELRSNIAARINKLLAEHTISSIEARLGGVSGIDCLPSHVHKGLPVRALTGGGDGATPTPFAATIGFSQRAVCEVWGDQFSVRQNGADTLMAVAAPPGTRALSFRSLPLCDVPEIPRMRVWPGPHYLDAGLADYLLTAVASLEERAVSTT
jgi:hydroxymethylpyrimidine pyrophosphatase-like HAD family hydrolase